MSTDYLSKPLSIKSIASQYTLPVVIQSALGFHGSSRPIILYSILNINFAFGRALKVYQSKKSEYQSFKPIDSEIVAIPIKYPGYFECLLPSSRESKNVVEPEKNIHSIVEQMQINFRSQIFYIASPMHVYTLEVKPDGSQNRLWHQIEAHQLITIEKLTYIEYTPTDEDNLTAEDYAYPWWFCFSKHILNRHEHVMKCILSDQQICFIPCSSTDEVCLYPVGQHGSTNVYKLHTIENLLEQFSLPTNIKLSQFPNSQAYKDFSGYLRLLGSQTREFAVCGSLTSTNVCLIPVNNSIKFVVTSIPLKSKEIINQLSRCQMFVRSFDNQIRRILTSSHDTSSHRSRSTSQSSMNAKRSISVEQDKRRSTEDVHQSEILVEKKRNGFRRARATTTSGDDSVPRQLFKRALSTGENSTYNSLVHPIRTKHLLKQSSSPCPSPSSKKSPSIHHPSTSFTYDTGSNLINDIDLPNANGSILLDNHNELFLSIKFNNRL